MTTWTVEGMESTLDEFRLGPVDLELRPGQTVAVLGSSGAGKTTLLRTLAGFLPLTAGWIRRDGQEISDLPPERRGLGYVPQGLGLFPHRTVERNVSYALEVRGRTDARARSRALLERFGLGDLAARYPARLSGGERQRVALARALAADPEVVVWDEPWQALDVEARHALGEVLDDLRSTERIPVVLVTHDPALAFSTAEEFLVLRKGRVVLAGDAARLLDHPPDAFVARFVGFENVYDPAALAGGASGSLVAWLRERSGPDGVAFGRPTLSALPGEGPWSGTVSSVRPTPEGLSVALRVDGLTVMLRPEAGSSMGRPALGARIAFSVEEKSLHALGSPVLDGRGKA